MNFPTRNIPSSLYENRHKKLYINPFFWFGCEIFSKHVFLEKSAFTELIFKSYKIFEIFIIKTRYLKTKHKEKIPSKSSESRRIKKDKNIFHLFYIFSPPTWKKNEKSKSSERLTKFQCTRLFPLTSDAVGSKTPVNLLPSPIKIMPLCEPIKH